MEKLKLYKVIVAAVLLALAVIFVSGIVGGDMMYHLKNRGNLGPLTRSDIEYLHVDAPEATSSDGTITAADWAETYPYIASSMHSNDKNSYITDYLEQCHAIMII